MKSIPRVVVALTLVIGVSCAHGAEGVDRYPSRPIRLLIPVAPGGTTDGLGRIIATRLAEVFHQTIVVDNRASASGVLATTMTRDAAPDGYTIFLPYTQHTINVAMAEKPPYHPADDFTPITQINEAGLLLVVNPSAPVKSPKEFIEWTKGYKGALNFGSAGIGSGGHLGGELYKMMVGLRNAQHIPYKGGGQAMIDLIGGQYQYSFAGLLGALPLARSGKLRAIAVTTPKRIPGLDDVPAMVETLPGFTVVGWTGLLAPPKLSKTLLARLHGEIVKIVREPETTKRIIEAGGTPVGSTPEEFRRFLLDDTRKWADVVKKSGARLE